MIQNKQIKPFSFGSQHDDIVHDVQLDPCSKLVATCSSDKTIKLFEVDSGKQHHRLVQTLRKHTSPVWKVGWKQHPCSGSLLASCSYDGRVII